MTPRRILLVYGSHYGQTAKIASRMADVIRTTGAAVTVANAGTLPVGLAARDFDVVVVGSSVEFARHQRSVERFVTAQRSALETMPTAFFSVSGAAGDAREVGRAEARGYVDAFVRRTGWHPTLIEMFGGATKYTRYNPFLRWVIKRGMAKSGGPTDTTRDWELTDWAAVERFAAQIATLVPLGASPVAATV